jgi:hypothetical protein
MIGMLQRDKLETIMSMITSVLQAWMMKRHENWYAGTLRTTIFQLSPSRKKKYRSIQNLMGRSIIKELQMDLLNDRGSIPSGTEFFSSTTPRLALGPSL